MRYRIRVQFANNLIQFAQNSLQLEIDLIRSESSSCSSILAPTRLVLHNTCFRNNNILSFTS